MWWARREQRRGREPKLVRGMPNNILKPKNDGTVNREDLLQRVSVRPNLTSKQTSTLYASRSLYLATGGVTIGDAKPKSRVRTQTSVAGTTECPLFFVATERPRLRWWKNTHHPPHTLQLPTTSCRGPRVHPVTRPTRRSLSARSLTAWARTF